MTPIYRGFDGLDVSFRAQISLEFRDRLEEAKLHAQSSSADTCLPFANMMMMVAPTGARGGYAYRVSTGRTGATWFFKKPNPSDPWGVRVSCSSFMLAEHGLVGAKDELYTLMERLGVRVQRNGESISRVDFAVDILAPQMSLSPDDFVMHSNANRADHLAAEEISVNGRSGRVTSVTIGKMPGRQVIVYDKRAEVFAKHKWAWLDIWNAARERGNSHPLDFSNPSQSRVWRTEIRAGKTHLKDRWNVRTWCDLQARFGDLALEATEAVRMTEPNKDSNRSRWPASSFWKLVQSEVGDDLFEMRNFAPPDLIKRVHKEAHLDLLERQNLGLLVTRAAILGISIERLADFALAEGHRNFLAITAQIEVMEERLRKSGMRYEALS